jgi:hypothetical protein
MLTLGRSPKGIYSVMRVTLKINMRITQTHFRAERWRLMKFNIFTVLLKTLLDNTNASRIGPRPEISNLDGLYAN